MSWLRVRELLVKALNVDQQKEKEASSCKRGPLSKALKTGDQT